MAKIPKSPSNLKNIKMLVSKSNPLKGMSKISASLGKKMSKESSLDSVKKRYSKKEILKKSLGKVK